jgi:hypothetical protein
MPETAKVECRVEFRQGVVRSRVRVDPFVLVQRGVREQLESKVTRINCTLYLSKKKGERTERLLNKSITAAYKVFVSHGNAWYEVTHAMADSKNVVDLLCRSQRLVCHGEVEGGW